MTPELTAPTSADVECSLPEDRTRSAISVAAQRLLVLAGLAAGAWFALAILGGSHADAAPTPPATHPVGSLLGSVVTPAEHIVQTAARPVTSVPVAATSSISKTADSTAKTAGSTAKSVTGAVTSTVDRTVHSVSGTVDRTVGNSAVGDTVRTVGHTVTSVVDHTTTATAPVTSTVQPVVSHLTHSTVNVVHHTAVESHPRPAQKAVPPAMRTVPSATGRVATPATRSVRNDAPTTVSQPTADPQTSTPAVASAHRVVADTGVRVPAPAAPSLPSPTGDTGGSVSTTSGPMFLAAVLGTTPAGPARTLIALSPDRDALRPVRGVRTDPGFRPD